MSFPSSESSDFANTIRRRRPAKACISCRDRRVKCEHERPTCSQCKKKGRQCVYQDGILPTVDFVTEPLSLATASVINPSSAPQTWSSVIKQQVDLIERSDLKKNTIGSSVPFWTLAETGEPSQERISHSPSNVAPKAGIRVSALGDWLATIFIPRLPSHETCYHFLENFLVSFQPVFPIFHVPRIRQEFSSFWTNLSPDTSVCSLVQISAILYVGAANSTNASDVDHSSSIRSLYEDALGAADFDGYHVTSSSIQLLQGFVIFNTYQASQRFPFSAFGFLARAIRFAQLQHLHVDQEGGSLVESEVRRRLWWHLIFLDVESTIANGLQGIIHPNGYTTELPSMSCDDAIIEDEEYSSFARDKRSLSPMMVAVQGHLRWAQRMQSWFERMPDQEGIAEYSLIIENLIRSIGEPEDSDWPRTYLQMQVDRAFSMLGLRFWQLDQFQGTDCHSEVIRTSRSFLHNYLRLSSLSVNLGFSWFIPGFIQPLHALIILLMHLNTCLHVNEESRLSKDLVDEIFRLRANRMLSRNHVPPGVMTTQEDTGVASQKSNSRYRLLWNLRNRVWQKLGWPILSYEPVQKENRVDAINQETSNDAQPVQISGLHSLNLDGHQDDSMTATLDNILSSGDPTDLLQWDEWITFSADAS